MNRLSPYLFNNKEEIAIGTSTLSEYTNHPLKLPYLTVMVCMTGKAVITVNFKSYLFQATNLLVLSEDSMTIFQQGSDDFECFYCLIDKSLATEIAYHLPNQLFPFLWESPLCHPMRDEIDILKKWQTQLAHILDRCTTYRHIMLRNHLQNLFLNIAERMPSTDTLTPSTYSRGELLCWKFWGLISLHCKEHREVAFYADQLCITPYYLSQLTKGFMNDTPKALIDRQVILEMKTLLSTTDISIMEIADQLHFDDTSYMNRYFKRHTKQSLTAYRK